MSFYIGADFRYGEEKYARFEARVIVVPHDALLNRMRGEFLEMPGLRLTREQAQRLCGVDRALCQEVLDILVDTSFLCVKPNGAYARLTDGADIPRPHPAKADIRQHSVKIAG